MDTVDPKKIQKLFTQVEQFEKAIKTAGEEGQDKLKTIKVDEVRDQIPTKDGKFDADAWSKLDQKSQRELYHQLTSIHDSLRDAAGLNGPSDKEHIMYAAYASSTAIIWWAVIGFLFTSVLLSVIVWQWGRATGTDLSLKVEVAIKALDELDKANASLEKTRVNWAKAQIEPVTSNTETVPNAAEEPNPEVIPDVAAEPNTKTEPPSPPAPKAEVDPKDKDEQIKKLKDELDTRIASVNQAKRDVNSTAVEAVKEIRKGGTTERTVLMMVVLLGGLGGSLHFLRSLVMFVGTRKLKRSWLLYYLSMPFTGAVLAPIVYMMLRVGLINPSGTSTNGSAVSNLNLIAIYVFSILSGLFARTALEKLHEVFKTLFRTQEPAAGDKISSEKPPGGADASP